MELNEQILEIKDYIDSLYGCDCAYYGVDGIGIATVLVEAGFIRKPQYRNKSTICTNCRANKVCDHNIWGFENCNNFIPIDEPIERASTLCGQCPEAVKTNKEKQCGCCSGKRES